MPFLVRPSGLIVPMLGAGARPLLNSPANVAAPVVPPTPPTPTPPTPTPPTPTPPTPTPTPPGNPGPWAILAKMGFGVNQERFTASSHEGAHDPAYYQYYRNLGIRQVRFFAPFGPDWGIGGSRNDVMPWVDACAACVASGMPVTHFDCTDVIGNWEVYVLDDNDNIVGERTDFINRVVSYLHVCGQIFAERVSEFPPDRFIIGPVNEYGGGDNAVWRKFRWEWNAILRSYLPNHTIVEGPAEWKYAGALFGEEGNRWGTYEPWPDPNTIQDVHHYRGWAPEDIVWLAEQCVQWSIANNRPVYGGEWGFGDWSMDSNVQQWIDRFDAMIDGIAPIRPTAWAVTDGNSWRMNDWGTNTMRSDGGDMTRAVRWWCERVDEAVAPSPPTPTPTPPTPTPPTPTPPTPTPTPPGGTPGPGRDDLLFDLTAKKNTWPCVNDQFEWLTADREWEYCYTHPNEGFAGIRWQPTWMRIDGFLGSWHPAEGEVHRIYRKGTSGQDAQTLVFECGPNPAPIPAGDAVVLWRTEDWNGGVDVSATVLTLGGFNIPLKQKLTVLRSTGSEPWNTEARRIVEIDMGTPLPAIDHTVELFEDRTRYRMRHWEFWADKNTKEPRHPLGWFQWITKEAILKNGGYVCLGGQQGQPTWRDWTSEYLDFGASLTEELWRKECEGLADMFGDTDPRKCFVELENEPVVDEYYDLLPDVWYGIARQVWGNDRTLMVKAASFGGTDHLRDSFNFTNPAGHNTILGSHIYPGQQHFDGGPAIGFYDIGETDYVAGIVRSKINQLGYKGGGFTEIGVYNFEWYDYGIKLSDAEIGRRYGRFLTSCANNQISMWTWGFVGGELHSADIRMVDGHMIEAFQAGMAPYCRRAGITTT